MLSVGIGSYSVGSADRENIHELLPPETVEGIMFRVSLLFRDSEDLDRATLDSLTKAYEAACDELAYEHYFSSSELAGLIDEMASAILDLYRAGQRSRTELTHHAVTCAILSNHERNKPW